MHVPVSACLIVKNDPHLERAVASIRPYVDEICIVDTGSTDGTAETARRIADKFEVFTACNFEDGEIADFSVARTRSFELASHDTVLWLDSDDVIDGGEHLQDTVAWSIATANGQPWRSLFAYEYDRDAEGHCVNWQLRERIVHPKAAFHWVYRVHEGLTAIQANEWRTLEPSHAIVWRHELDKSKPRSRRNIRILRDDITKRGGSDAVDAKTQFDIGMEYAKSGDHRMALAWLSRFVTSSDLDDERVLACLHMVDVLSYWPGREQDAAIWAHRATEIMPMAPAGHWALAKLAYGQANKARSISSERRHLQRVVYYARKGLATPVVRSRAPSNPLDRPLNIPWILQDALTRLGDHAAALDAMRTVAMARPDDVRAALRIRECERAAGVIPTNSVDVVIVCGSTQETWDPATAAVRGIGGSETAVIELGSRLAALGARVRVYCQCQTPGLYDGVEYRSMGDAHEAAGCDILVAWRNATLLETIPARYKWLWLHDTEAIGATPWNLTLADRILVLSQWHKSHVAELYPSHAYKLTVTRNGIDLARFDRTAKRNPHKAIYSSSPDRGLEVLLDMWPRIRAQVPDAELHVFYGWTGAGTEYRDKMLARIDATDGVIARDRVDQHTLAREMLRAGVWMHPSWVATGKKFHETSCIGAMEAQAAGMRVVASYWGALHETVGSVGALIVGDATDTDYQRAFIGMVISALVTDGPWLLHERADVQAIAARRFSWDGVAAQWFDLATNDAEGVTINAIASIDRRPTLHMILAPQASGDVPMDARNPGGEAMGGGSRVGFLGLVKAMGKRNEYRVRAFSTFNDPVVVKGGVEYVRLDRISTYDSPDVAFAFYDTSPLAAFGPETLRIASHHTYSPYMHFDSADVNTSPSPEATDYLRDNYDPTGVWYTLPNGCDAPTFERTPVDGRIIYHTSPDRGLHLLLEAYPAIKARVPHASLHIVGDLRGYIETTKTGPFRLRPRAERMERALAVAEELGGVQLLGRLRREDLNRELAEASVFAFPCAPIAPCETFSLSIMECCALGVPVVLRPADALESIYEGSVRMVHGDPNAGVHDFANAVSEVLTDPILAADLSVDGRRLAAQYSFANEAAVLSQIIETSRGSAVCKNAAE